MIPGWADESLVLGLAACLPAHGQEGPRNVVLANAGKLQWEESPTGLRGKILGRPRASHPRGFLGPSPFCFDGRAHSSYPDGKEGRRLTRPIGDIACEVVGHVTNPSPTTSNQYGYLSLINGLSAEQIFNTDNLAQNETTALFTFFCQRSSNGVNLDSRRHDSFRQSLLTS